ALTDAAGGHWQILTGCRRGHVRQAFATGGIPAAEAALLDLVDRFGADRVTVELTRHGYPDDHERNAALFELAARHGIPCIASTAAHFAHPHRRRLAMAVAAISDRQSLDDAVGRIPPTGGGHLRSGEEMTRLFEAFPGVVHHAAELGRECAFDLRLVAPKLPPFDVPDGHTE